MRYAEVAVDAPVGHSRTFSYSIPPRYSLEPGQMVWVPFGSRLTQGIVTELAATSQVEETRRSEEHTSELQSQAYLVCRLLLEKKKKRPQCVSTQHI